MSKEQTPITAEEYYKQFEHIPLTKGIVVELMELYANKVTQAKVLEALEPIIQECKKVIDSPNHLESTKGFASIIWNELEQSKQK